MYRTYQRKSRNKIQDKQLLKGITVFFVVGICAVLFIVARLLN